MQKIIILFLSTVLILTGCSNNTSQEEVLDKETEKPIEVEETTTIEETGSEDPSEEVLSPYRRIEAKEAKEQLASDETILLLDVRTEAEYNGGHIPGAELLPLDTISNSVEEKYPDKDQVIYVYCRSGRRSEASAAILLDLGYKNVYDLGGITSWPYEIE